MIKCKFLTRRTKRGCPYWYCRYYKKEISLPCDKNCSERILKPNTPISKISSKRRKLEKDRDSKLIKIGKCENCGKYCQKLDAHEVYSGANRKRSIQYGFVALLCRECHSNEYIIAELKKKYQKEYEIDHTRQQFIDIIGKSYL